MQNNFLESTSFSGEAPVRMSWNLAQKRFIKCDLSQENVPYDIRSNSWMHGKRTDKRIGSTAERMQIFFERLSRTAEQM